MKHAKSEKTELERRLEVEAAEESAAETSSAPNEETSAEPVALEEFDINALLTERDELKDLLLRSRAEFDNYRKRVARDNERMRKMAAEALLRGLLPVADNLERALEHAGDPSGGFAQGVEMVLKQLQALFAENGVNPIAGIGTPFDPTVHEAVMRMSSNEYATDTVAQEFLRGYKLGDFVLRPAKVVVSAGPPAENNGEANAATPSGEEQGCC